jgi:hypothetical protein
MKVKKTNYFRNGVLGLNESIPKQPQGRRIMPEQTTLPTDEKEYQYVKFDFTTPTISGDGRSYETEAYLLVPVAVMPELEKWEKADEKTRTSALNMYSMLLAKDAILHCEDGYAFTVVDSYADGHKQIIHQEHWVKGQLIKPPAPRVHRLGVLKL